MIVFHRKKDGPISKWGVYDKESKSKVQQYASVMIWVYGAPICCQSSCLTRTRSIVFMEGSVCSLQTILLKRYLIISLRIFQDTCLSAVVPNLEQKELPFKQAQILGNEKQLVTGKIYGWITMHLIVTKRPKQDLTHFHTEFAGCKL